MHRHKIVAQILLIFSIINSVLAAPAVSVREIHEARRAVAVRVPGEGAAAVLQKGPYLSSPWPSLEHPVPREDYHDALTEFSPSHQPEMVYHDASTGLNPSHQPEVVYHDASTGLNPSHQPEEVYHDASTGLNPSHQSEVDYHDASTGLNPSHQSEVVYHDASTEFNPPKSVVVYHDAPTEFYPLHQQEVYHDVPTEFKPLQAVPEEGHHVASSGTNAWETAWKKTMTPEKLKAAKYVGIAGLVTIAYMGLLLPDITKNDGQAQDQGQASQS